MNDRPRQNPAYRPTRFAPREGGAFLPLMSGAVLTQRGAFLYQLESKNNNLVLIGYII
jgi:hypothetical protein